jgi:hypothetical protein
MSEGGYVTGTHMQLYIESDFRQRMLIIVDFE